MVPIPEESTKPYVESLERKLLKKRSHSVLIPTKMDLSQRDRSPNMTDFTLGVVGEQESSRASSESSEGASKSKSSMKAPNTTRRQTMYASPLNLSRLSLS